MIAAFVHSNHVCEQFTLGTTKQTVTTFNMNVINYSTMPVQARTNFVYCFLNAFVVFIFLSKFLSYIMQWRSYGST